MHARRAFYCLSFYHCKYEFFITLDTSFISGFKKSIIKQRKKTRPDMSQHLSSLYQGKDFVVKNTVNARLPYLVCIQLETGIRSGLNPVLKEMPGLIHIIILQKRGKQVTGKMLFVTHVRQTCFRENSNTTVP